MKRYYIPTSNVLVPYNLPVEVEGKIVTVNFIPLENEHTDDIGFELFLHNCAPIDSATIRANMIEAVFELYGEDAGEDIANFLDEHWQSEDLYEQRYADWKEADRQRLIDEKAQKKKIPATPAPKRQTTPRQRSRADMIIRELTDKTMRLREMSLDMQTYNKRTNELCARLAIQSVTHDGQTVELERTGSPVSEDAWLKLRTHVGVENIRALVRTVAEYGQVNREEEGNSSSPPSTDSNPESSQTQDAETTGNGASSSDTTTTQEGTSPSPSEPTQEAASASTTGELSSNTSDAGTESGNTEPTPAEPMHVQV